MEQWIGVRRALLAGMAASMTFVAETHAGGWPLPAGKGEIILTGSRLTANERYESNGKKRWTSRYTKYEISSYAEYGLFDNLTLIGEAAWKREKTDFFGITFEDDGFSRVKAGARYAIGTWQETLFSVQTLATLHLDDAGDDPAATKSGDIDAELGLVLARNETLFGMNIFSVQEVAWRYRDRGRPDQIRADITLGGKPFDGTILLLKSLNTASVASTQSGELYRSSKLAISIVQNLPEHLAPGVALEAGMERTIAGQGTVADTTWRLGLWYRF
ncbi:hypothetical protein [Parvibaculum sp.]|uniref:hypothetical protein n=1 Tax=Parvibaculum sp. TaxID=2024848 RepID=UPI003919C993